MCAVNSLQLCFFCMIIPDILTLCLCCCSHGHSRPIVEVNYRCALAVACRLCFMHTLPLTGPMEQAASERARWLCWIVFVLDSVFAVCQQSMRTAQHKAHKAEGQYNRAAVSDGHYQSQRHRLAAQQLTRAAHGFCWINLPLCNRARGAQTGSNPCRHRPASSC
jgi:hypothetical protein